MVGWLVVMDIADGEAGKEKKKEEKWERRTDGRKREKRKKKQKMSEAKKGYGYDSVLEACHRELLLLVPRGW